MTIRRDGKGLATVSVSNDSERATSLINSHNTAREFEDAPPQTATEKSGESSVSINPVQSDAALEVDNFFTLAVDELTALRTRAEVDAIESAAQLILKQEKSGGRVHVTGIGKSEHVARYAASLLSSTGTPAYFLHATECVHGSAGQVRKEDVLIAISNSGETPELLHAVTILKDFGVSIVCVSGQSESQLAKLSAVILNAGVENEGGVLNLVPRASILAKIYVLCALSVSLETHKGLTREQYAQWHPSGALGRLARGE